MNYKQRDSLSFQKLEGTEREMIISSKGNTNTQSSTDRKYSPSIAFKINPHVIFTPTKMLQK